MEQKPTTLNKNWLASLTQGLPPTYWLLWSGTLINRLGGLPAQAAVLGGGDAA